MKKFTEKVVVITGASAGIGRATALEFAKEGASLGLISRNKARLEKAKDEIENLGGKAEIFIADVADPKKLEESVEYFEKTLGPIDIWVNNAMTTVFSPVKEMTPDEFKRVTDVTYLGVVYGTLAVLPKMLRRDRGLIVQVGSALAYRGIPLQSAYCAAKHAIQGFHDSLRTELLHDKSNMRVTMVQLPAHNTPQFDWAKSNMPKKAQPVPPIFQPEVAARAIVWLCCHDRRELIVGWPALKAIWANKFFPGLVDRFLASGGYSGQMTEEMDDPDRPNNLWQTVEGDFGAHGRFNERSKDKSYQLILDMHKNKVFAVLGATVLLLLVLII